MSKIRGFTLLEMIISMLIISAIVLMIYVSYSLVVRTWKKNQEQTADFRLEVIGDRLLMEDWKYIVPYNYGTERGQYTFLSGSPTHLIYATTHRLGARLSLGGGMYFTLLLLKPADDGVNLYCYKVDWPDQDLMLLAQLYQSGSRDPQINALEAGFMDQSLILKSVDEAIFSFDTKSANQTQALAKAELAIHDLDLLPLEIWQGQEAPRRIRLSWRDEDWSTWVEGELPELAELSDDSQNQTLETNNAPPNPDLEGLGP